jgi:hypothetical protein
MAEVKLSSSQYDKSEGAWCQFVQLLDVNFNIRFGVCQISPLQSYNFYPCSELFCGGRTLALSKCLVPAQAFTYWL